MSIGDIIGEAWDDYVAPWAGKVFEGTILLFFVGLLGFAAYCISKTEYFHPLHNEWLAWLLGAGVVILVIAGVLAATAAVCLVLTVGGLLIVMAIGHLIRRFFPKRARQRSPSFFRIIREWLYSRAHGFCQTIELVEE